MHRHRFFHLKHCVKHVQSRKIELGTSLSVHLSTMNELILQLQSLWENVFPMCEMQEWILIRSTNGDGVGEMSCMLHTAGEDCLVVPKGRSQEGRMGDISWVAVIGGGGSGSSHAAFGREWMSLCVVPLSGELCASLKGDRKETEPHCCCHGHSASQFSAVGNGLV